MTEIVIDIRKLSGVEASESEAATTGTFSIYPYAALRHDDHIVTKRKLRVKVEGTGSVFLPPTGAGEGMVFEPIGIPGLSKGVYEIPDSVSAVNLIDLVQLDPDTLDPTPDVIAAWDAALAAFNVRVTAVEEETRDNEILTWQGI